MGRPYLIRQAGQSQHAVIVSREGKMEIVNARTGQLRRELAAKEPAATRSRRLTHLTRHTTLRGT